jgi:hypothetical protein
VSDAGETVSEADAAACVTETVCVMPPPVTVIVAVRALPVLAVTLTYSRLLL